MLTQTINNFTFFSLVDKDKKKYYIKKLDLGRQPWALQKDLLTQVEKIPKLLPHPYSGAITDVRTTVIGTGP